MNEMKANNRDDIKFLVKKIESGSFDRTDIKALLITMREYLPIGNLIEDLSNFVAHSETRDRGIVCNRLNSLVDNMVESFKKEGKIKVEGVFSADDIIDALYKCADYFLLGIMRQPFLDQKEKIINALNEIIEDTVIEVKNPFVSYSKLERINGIVRFVFRIDGEADWVIKIPENKNVRMAVDLFK